ncbi:MAG: hypothetical protein JWO80_5789 [Bryobacterales bacterium]|nr:hypothetical protein [Bryobacterales bacterium]
MTFFKDLILAAMLCTPAIAAETKVKMESLPPAVQQAVKDQTQNAKLVGISKEVENGKTMYEVETMVNGKSRDLMLDATGQVASVEQEVGLDSIPASAREAIQKKTAGGKIKKVELVTVGSEKSYEAAYAGKNGKSAEFSVNADGSVHK